MNMFDDDTYLSDIFQSIKDCINEGFDTANQYAQTFQKYQSFYIDNETLDLEALRQIEHGKFTKDWNSFILFFFVYRLLCQNFVMLFHNGNIRHYGLAFFNVNFIEWWMIESCFYLLSSLYLVNYFLM